MPLKIFPKSKISAFHPYIVFLIVCAVYFTFPLYNFNADSLHYNLLSFAGAANPRVLFSDEVTPVHLLWHLFNTALIRILSPVTFLQSLYYLQLANIVLSLLYIFLFLTFVRQYARDLTVMFSVLILSFSHACLSYFLSLEVYTLNNISILCVFYMVYGLVRQKIPFNTASSILLAFVSFLAVLSHLTNFLLIFTIALFFLITRFRKKYIVLGTYLVVTSLLILGVIVVLAVIRNIGFGEAVLYFLNYSRKMKTYAPMHIFSDIVFFIRMMPTVFTPRFTLFMVLSFAVSLFLLVKYAARTVYRDPFIRFVGLYLLVHAAFFSQWDVDNLEHKLIFVPALLIGFSVSITHFQAALPRLWKGVLILMVAILIVLNVRFTILENATPDQNIGYRLAQAVQQQTTSSPVLVIDSPLDSLPLFSLTFFNQQVEVVSSENKHFQEKLHQYHNAGYNILHWSGSQFEPRKGG